jgi:lipoyl(octanoyl) transferase
MYSNRSAAFYARFLSSRTSFQPPFRRQTVDPGCCHVRTSFQKEQEDGCDTTPVDYVRGWAWQQLILNRRLAFRRHRKSYHDEDLLSNYMDTDTILLFEHTPVYTLGRGAQEDHFTFLGHNQTHLGQANKENFNGLDDEKMANCDEIKRRLSRSYRGFDSARLQINKSALGVDNLDDLFLTVPKAGILPRDLPNYMREREHIVVDKLSAAVSTPVLAPRNVPIYRVERGGEVTFHGPGQLVVYPLLDLNHACAENRSVGGPTKNGSLLRPDLHLYLRQVEDIIIRTLAEFGIDDAARDEINTGVWVNQAKIAAVGVSASRWITTHGFALNVDSDLSFFDTSVVLPCGIVGRNVTSITEVLRGRYGDSTAIPTVSNVADIVLKHSSDVFGLKFTASAPVR